ncbi:hypothetical protein GCM10007036_04560 [Alsobacter metallidurans]|uniref:Yip1 domain-containing protein n=1 Tax=Alsobacter metallidurans TaxID=340221 RepID=A0A917MG96_9HYPH|nr:hypothetical protein [Alsobacter metallidurans]GGH08842.1 hypothetical protein GCM10007036_04560 [Alsobacter metallidurans]
MFLTMDEVGRSLAGSVKLLNRDPEGLGAFEVSFEAFWRSFAAMLLVAPAFVVLLADARLQAGLPLEDGLFESPLLVTRQALLVTGCWLAFPIAMVGLARLLGVGRRYARYIIAYNWSAVVATTIMAAPHALHVVGWATAGLTTLFLLAFGVLIVQCRWFLAKTALGVSGGVAAVVVLVELCVNGAVTAAASLLA